MIEDEEDLDSDTQRQLRHPEQVPGQVLIYENPETPRSPARQPPVQ